MARRMERDEMKIRSPQSQKSLLWLCHRSVAVFVSVLLLSESVTANSSATGVKMAQQPAATEQDANRAAAKRAEEEAKQLNEQNAPLTRRIAKWEESLKYWRAAKERKKEARILDNIAKLYWFRGEYRKALDYAQQSLSISQVLDERDGKGAAVSSIALIYEELGEYQKAIDNYKQVPLLFPNTPEIPATVFLKIGSIYRKLGEKQKELDSYKQALAFWKQKGNVLKQAETLDIIATFYSLVGNVQKGIDTFKQANTLDPDLKRDRTVLKLNYQLLAKFGCEDKLVALGNVPIVQQPDSSSNQSSNTNSNYDFQRSVEKYRALESLRFEADFLDSLASLEYIAKGEYQKALDAYQQALQLRQTMGARPQEAETLTYIADVLNNQGEKQKAINHLNQALDIQRQINVRPDEANTLLSLGDVYQTLGAYDLSLDAYNQALSVYRAIGESSNETRTLLQIGSVYQQLEDRKAALNSYQQALSVSRTTGNCLQEAKSLINITKTYAALEDYPQAIKVGNAAIALSRNLGVDEQKLASQALTLNILAQVEIKQGNYYKALELAQQALKVSREMKGYFRDVEADALAVNAETYEALKQPEKAIQTYQEQLSLYRTLSWNLEQAQTRYNLAQLERKRGNRKEALTQIDAAINIIENIRQEVASPELRTTFFASKQDYYELKIDLLMQLHQQNPSQGYNALALQASERARARSLLELLTEANADIRTGVDPQLLQQERTLQQQLNAKAEAQIKFLSSDKPNEAQAQALAKELETLNNQLKELQAQIRVKSPRYADLKYPQPLTLKEIQQQVLDDETLLLEYSLGKERSYLWAVTPTSITSYELPPRQEIETAATNFFAEVTNRTNRKLSPKAVQLSQILLQPVAAQLDKKRLLIVSNGGLQTIPFGALPVATRAGGGENSSSYVPLLSEHEVVSLPSASTLAVTRREQVKRQPAPKALAILADPVFSADDERLQGNPIPQQTDVANSTRGDVATSAKDVGITFPIRRLDGTRTEAEQILALVPANQKLLALDFQANSSLAMSPQLSEYRIVHFATHGFVNNVHPELSGIVLSLVNEKGVTQNGFLRLNEIFNLQLPADLVVLSACKTGRGKDVSGEGLVGLTRGFMYAGASRVVVSLWYVDDKATAELMTRFYKGMLQKGLKPAAALRAAQLEMSQDPQWSSPVYWAAFMLQGEWK